MLHRLRRRATGVSARLAVSYVLVTLAVVVLVEAVVLGYQAPGLVNDARRQVQVDTTAKTYVVQLVQRYPGGIVPVGTRLGQRGRRLQPGQVSLNADGVTLVVPAISGPVPSHKPVTAVVVIAANGTVVAASAPALYPPGRPVVDKLPATAAADLGTSRSGGASGTGSGSGPDGPVNWALLALPGFGKRSSARRSGPLVRSPARYLYLQAPEATGFVNPIDAWDELRQLSGAGPFLSASYALLIAIVPVGVAFGLIASRRLVRRVRRLERATLAVADGDYNVALAVSGRDELARLEANFTAMARQLGSALAAERERATADARAGERARLAREIHDAISQHLFGLRMIAAGMRKTNPGDEKVQAIERITQDANRDMQTLLLELRPLRPDGAGLAPALREVCAAYQERLGVTIDVDLDEVAVPEPVEHALLRIAQEAFANAVRHGNARALSVSLARRPGHVELAVRDTGTGFDPTAPQNGSGLRHMRDRAAELGGTVEVDGVAGGGVAVTARIPVP